WRVNCTSRRSIHGPATRATRAMASSLGMKLNVISLICVAAWMTPTSRPTASAVSSSGPDTSMATYIACCPNAITDSGVIRGLLLFALRAGESKSFRAPSARKLFKFLIQESGSRDDGGASETQGVGDHV